MTTVSKRRKRPAGASPGSVVYVGADKTTPVTVSCIQYSADRYDAPRVVSPKECRPVPTASGVTWFTIDGVHDVEIVKTIGENFGLHPLVVEDIGNTTQRPKLEGFDGYYFLATKMIRDESPLLSKGVKIFLRDLYDHTVHVIDSVETMRDIITGTLDVYLSSVSNRLNEVMKVLTVMSSIFIPLTFIVGVYGINFQYMPELTWRWGYPAVWLFMIALSFVLLAIFKRKKWM